MVNPLISSLYLILSHLESHSFKSRAKSEPNLAQHPMAGEEDLPPAVVHDQRANVSYEVSQLLGKVGA